LLIFAAQILPDGAAFTKGRKPVPKPTGYEQKADAPHPAFAGRASRIFLLLAGAVGVTVPLVRIAARHGDPAW